MSNPYILLKAKKNKEIKVAPQKNREEDSPVEKLAPNNSEKPGLQDILKNMLKPSASKNNKPY